jgi:hypothetical protein
LEADIIGHLNDEFFIYVPHSMSIKSENAIRQASKANASEGEDHNFFFK